jgi:phenylacetic acid degradation operon negative regulatory protein
MSKADALLKRRSLAILNGFLDTSPSRTPSLLMTLFGDTVVSRGTEIWLGSLVRLLEPLGISEGLVRTSVYRLAQDNWIEGAKSGRRSYYRLTASAKAEVLRSDRRIYYHSERPWDGQWRLVFTGTQGISTDQRTHLRKRLTRMGFGVIAPNVYGHPTGCVETLWDTFADMGIADRVVVMRADSFDQTQGLDAREMARQCFNLETLEQEYRNFIGRYEPLVTAIEKGAETSGLGPAHCFALRTLLIHQYRRILLRDPDLPTPLLPDLWAGSRARRICGFLYRALLSESEKFIRSRGENRDGRFTGMAQSYQNRFPL